MKECPRCGQVFSDVYTYCLTDGTPLENEGELTLARHNPEKGIDDSWNTPTVLSQTPIEFILPKMPAEPKPRPASRFLYIVLGTIIGAALVTAGFLLLRRPSLERNVISSNVETRRPATPNSNGSGNTGSSNATNQAVQSNIGGNVNRANNSQVPDANVPKQDASNRPVDTPSGPKYNGRVVTTSAVLRLSPGMDGLPLLEIDYDTPLKIGRRAGPNSPWYKVTTPDGVTGWMHGNTFEFTSQ